MTLLEQVRRSWPPPVRVRAGRIPVPLTGTEPVAVLDLSGGHAVVVAEVPDRPTDRLHCVPVTRAGGQWQQAEAGDGVANALVRQVDAGSLGEFTLRPGREPPPVVPSHASEQAITSDEGRERVVVGERSAVTWFRRPTRGLQAGMVLPAHLDEVGFRATPRLHGTLAWRGILLADMNAHLPGARGGWEWYLDLANGWIEDPEVQEEDGFPAADELGALTAGLHHALAMPSSLIPRPTGTAEVAPWREQAHETLNRAVTLIGERWLSRRKKLIARMIDMEYGNVERVPVQPIHGNLHVGQVLLSPRGMALTGFGGSATPGVAGIGEPQSPGRDFAQLWCSIGHVGYLAERRMPHIRRSAIESWITENQVGFLSGYRWAMGGAPDERMHLAFIIEQQCRELVDAATRLPEAWSYAPEAGLRELFPKEREGRNTC